MLPLTLLLYCTQTPLCNETHRIISYMQKILLLVSHDLLSFIPSSVFVVANSIFHRR